MSKSILTFAFLLSAVLSSAQEYSYRFYTVSDGLPQTQITYLFQDSKGFIWIGTKGGVSRFDGIDFENFGLEDGLTSRIVCHISEGYDGKIYVLCDHGFSVFDGSGFRSYPFPDHIRVYMVTTRVTHDPAGNFWIAARIHSATPFLKFSNGTYSDARLDLPVPDTAIVNDIIFDDADSAYIIGTAGSSIYLCRDHSCTNILTGIHSIILVHEQQDHLIFTGKYPDARAGKLFRVSLSEPYKVSVVLDSIDAITSYLNDDHFFFLNTGDLTIKEYKNGTVAKYHRSLLQYNAAMYDREGNIWIGTETGLYRLLSGAFLNLTKESGINEYVWSITEDKKGDLLFASFKHGLTLYNGKTFVKYDFKDISNTFYRGAIRTHNGNVLLTTATGVIEYDGHTFRNLKGIPRTAALFLYEDTLRQRLLISSARYGLLIREKDGKIKKYRISPGPVNEYISTINMDTLGRYWLGGFYGMSVMEGDSLIQLPAKGFPYDKGAIASYRDSLGNLWFGTTSGLYLYDHEHFRKVGGDRFKTYIMSLAGMAGNKLFIGMIQGIGILDLQAFYSTGKEDIMLLDHSSGFLGEECKQNGVYTDTRGYTWVATSDRVVRIDPGKIKKDTSRPVIYLRSVRTLSGERDTILDLPLDTTPHLRWFQKDLQFDYHALYYKAPTGVRYSYILEGYDNDWSPPAAARYAKYTNLRPGTYEFRVRACNENGVWCEEPAVYKFSIIPALWQTRAFLILVNTLFLLTIGLMIYLYLRRRRKRKEERDALDKQFAELKLLTIRNQMDPHFTFNAITSLGTLIYTEQKESAYDYLVKFSGLIRKTLESSNKITRTLEEELDFIRDYLELQNNRFRNKFEYKISLDKGVDPRTLIPRMIIETHVENALKHGLVHSDKKGMIDIEVKKEDHALLIVITDNGIGRERSREYSKNSTRIGLRVTEQFYTLINKYNKAKITRRIIDLYDDAGHPAGTRVIIRIPEGVGYEW